MICDSDVLMIPAVVKRQFPAVFTLVMANDVSCAIIPAKFEIPVIGGKPAIEDFFHSHCMLSEIDNAGLLLAPVPRVAIDVNRYGFDWLLRHTDSPFNSLDGNYNAILKNQATGLALIIVKLNYCMLNFQK